MLYHMTLTEAADLARSLIAEHDLRGFEFGWVEEYPQFMRLNARPRGAYLAGACLHVGGKILLSRIEVTFCPADVEDTILHEIAHALLGTYDHGEDWCALAAEMGCDVSDYV